MISTVVAENGKVEITLNQEDYSLSSSDFTAVLYKDGESKGEELKLSNYKMNDEVVTFTFDEIPAGDYTHSYVVGITLDDYETDSNAFTVEGELGEVRQTMLKEDVLEQKYINGYVDGTFRPDNAVTRAEALKMISALVEVPEVSGGYQLATIDVLQADKDQTSIAKQFFVLEGLKVTPLEEGYYVELVILNEGMGFRDILASVEHKVGSTYTEIEIIKADDLKSAVVGITVDNLEDAIVLRTGIVPMGSVKPELRVVITDLVDGAFVSQYTDIEMWAKDAIMAFEKLGVIGGDGETLFSPTKEMTIGEAITILAKIMGYTAEDFTTEEAEEMVTEVLEGSELDEEISVLDQTITRAGLVALINHTIGHTEETNREIESPFTDLDETHWAYAEILKIVNVPDVPETEEAAP